MIDILYIHPSKSLSSKMYCVMPVGAIAVLNLLREQGYSVYGINVGLENSLNAMYSLKSDLENIDYKVLICDLHWYDHAYCTVQIAMLSKEIKPNVPVIVGGMTASIYSAEILEKYDCIDYILKGDTEKPAIMLMESIMGNAVDIQKVPNIAYRHIGTVRSKKNEYVTEGLDYLNYIDIDFIKNHEYVYQLKVDGIKNCRKIFWLCVARGCAYNCANCSGALCNNETLYGRNHLLVRSPAKVFEDIGKLCERGVETICISHDMEMLGKSFYTTLFSLLRKNHIKPGLYVECFQSPSIPYLEDLIQTVDLNRTIFALSPNTGDEVARARNGKSFSNKELVTTVEYLTSKSVKTNIYYSLNLPYETEKSFERTLEQIKFICKNYQQVGITASKVVIDPLAQMRHGKESVKPLLNSFIDYYNYCTNNDYYFVGYEEMDSTTLRKRENEIKTVLRESNARFYSIGSNYD